MTDVYVPPQLLGSSDFSGGAAPAGGSHTGMASIVMRDGLQFQVAHNRAEVLRKLDAHVTPSGHPRWIGFDRPGAANPVVLNADEIASVQ